jgi:hypothetical protein
VSPRRDVLLHVQDARKRVPPLHGRNTDLQSVRPAEFHSAERAGVCRGAAVPAVGQPDILSGGGNLAGETPACPTDKMSAPRCVFQRPVFRI